MSAIFRIMSSLLLLTNRDAPNGEDSTAHTQIPSLLSFDRYLCWCPVGRRPALCRYPDDQDRDSHPVGLPLPTDSATSATVLRG